jgi:hypothetical protein
MSISKLVEILEENKQTIDKKTVELKKVKRIPVTYIDDLGDEYILNPVLGKGKLWHKPF